MNSVAASFDTDVRQMTEMSQPKKAAHMHIKTTILVNFLSVEI